MEAEHQRQEQRRIALECQQQQQQEQQYNLKLLGQWQEAAIALDRSASYLEQIQEITTNYQPVREDYCSKATGLRCLLAIASEATAEGVTIALSFNPHLSIPMTSYL